MNFKKIILIFLISASFNYVNGQNYNFDTYYNYHDSASGDEYFVLSNSTQSTHTLIGKYQEVNPTIGTLRLSNSNLWFSFLVENLYDLRYLAQDSIKLNFENDYEYSCKEILIDENHLKLEIKFFKIKKKSKKLISESYIIYEKSNDFKFSLLAIDYFTHCLITRTEYKESNFGYPIEIFTKKWRGKKLKLKLKSKLKIDKSVNVTVND